MTAPSAGPAALTLPAILAATLLERARARPDEEICGLIGNDFSHYPIANRAAAPQHAFEMDVREQIAVLRELRAHRQRLLAIYHSHPRGEAAPSGRDLELAGYPESCMLIIGLRARHGEMRAWRLEGTSAREIGLRIRD